MTEGFCFCQKKLDRLQLFVCCWFNFGRQFGCRTTSSPDERLVLQTGLFVYSVSICEYWQSEQLICAQFSSACRVWLYILNLQEATRSSLFKVHLYFYFFIFQFVFSLSRRLQSFLLEINHIVLQIHFDSCGIVQECNLIGKVRSSVTVEIPMKHNYLCIITCSLKEVIILISLD